MSLFDNTPLAAEFRAPTKKRAQASMYDYDGFVEKFEVKKTTDDRYTPPAVYDIILRYVGRNYDLTGKNIIRPFYPGGNYKCVEYGENDVVLDNPPFSIISQIVRFYDARGVKYFLFAPHLTLFSSENLSTKIVVCADIKYENGAMVKTSFLSNLFGDIAVMSAPDLSAELNALNRSVVTLPKYEYPDNVLTISMVADFSSKGVPFRVLKSELAYIRGLDSQRTAGKSIFGSGYLLSEKAAAEKAAAEKVNVITWPLSDRERRIIEGLK